MLRYDTFLSRETATPTPTPTPGGTKVGEVAYTYSGNNDAITRDLPATAEENDIIIVLLTCTNGGPAASNPIPSGSLIFGLNSQLVVSCGFKRMTGGETSIGLQSLNGTSTTNLFMLQHWRGLDDLLSGVQSAAGGQDTAPDPPAYNPPSSPLRRFIVGGHDSNAVDVSSWPGGFTDQWTSPGSGRGMIASEYDPDGGSFDPGAWAMTASAYWKTAHFGFSLL